MEFLTVGNIGLSPGNELIELTVIGLSWTLRLGISQLGLELWEDSLIISTIVSPTEWIGPSVEFFAVCNICFTPKYNFFIFLKLKKSPN